MPTIMPFGHDTVKTFLDAQGLRYLRDSDGDFCVTFAPDDQDGEFRVWLIASGPQRDIYMIRMHTTRRFARDEWAECLALANSWNEERRWPKAYFHLNDAANDSRGEIILENQISLEAGIHQELFDAYTIATLAAGFAFWRWIRETPASLAV